MVRPQMLTKRGQAEPAALNLVAHTHIDEAAQDTLEDGRVDTELGRKLARGRRTVLRKALGDPQFGVDAKDLSAKSTIRRLKQ